MSGYSVIPRQRSFEQEFVRLTKRVRRLEVNARPMTAPLPSGPGFGYAAIVGGNLCGGPISGEVPPIEQAGYFPAAQPAFILTASGGSLAPSVSGSIVLDPPGFEATWGVPLVAAKNVAAGMYIFSSDGTQRLTIGTVATAAIGDIELPEFPFNTESTWTTFYSLGSDLVWTGSGEVTSAGGDYEYGVVVIFEMY